MNILNNLSTEIINQFIIYNSIHNTIQNNTYKSINTKTINNKNIKLSKVYFITDGMYIKIGNTKGSIKKRIQQLNTGSANKLYLIGWIYGDKNKEKELHMKFHNDKCRFDSSGSEWFYADNIIQWLNSDDNNLMSVWVDWIECDFEDWNNGNVNNINNIDYKNKKLVVYKKMKNI